MALTPNNINTWNKAIDSYIKDELEQSPKSVYDMLFKVVTTDRLESTDVPYSGYNRMEEVSDLGDAVEDEVREGYPYAYRRRQFRKQSVFSSNLLQTDQIGEVETMARDLVRTQKTSRDLYAMSMFRRAWDTGQVFGDSKPLISTLHPLKDGSGTQSNTFSGGTQRPLTYENAILLQDVLLDQISNSSNLLTGGDSNHNHLIVTGPENREAAFQAANPNGPTGQPDSTDNNLNYIKKGEKFDVLITKYFSYRAAFEMGETTVTKTASGNFYDDMWLLIDKNIFTKYAKMRIAETYPTFKEETNLKNEALIRYVYDKYDWGSSGYLGLAGSKGDNTTYSS